MIRSDLVASASTGFDQSLAQRRAVLRRRRRRDAVRDLGGLTLVVALCLWVAYVAVATLIAR